MRVYQTAVESAMKIFEITKTFPNEEKYSLVDQTVNLQPVCSQVQESTSGELLYQPDYHSRLSGILLKSFRSWEKIPDKPE